MSSWLWDVWNGDRLDNSLVSHLDLASYAATGFLETQSSRLWILSVSYGVLPRPSCCRSAVWEGLMLAISQGLKRPRSWLELLSKGPRETVSKILQRVDRALVFCPAHHWQGPFSAAVATMVFVYHLCSLSRRNPLSSPTHASLSLRPDLGSQPRKGAWLLKGPMCSGKPGETPLPQIDWSVLSSSNLRNPWSHGKHMQVSTAPGLWAQ